ncbi:hypothetical protein [Dyadobacter sp. CY323]|uniref:hypothetical protein n=1 Tax=Dyadobacter sp. CY323 TaxID=2907302 RepID=UPI001F376C32|nr:hypothetical protein [Dyadobacter sp. CY323]MCE6989231.1 hypothetical protein [Dyadobacter sp. CY323]
MRQILPILILLFICSCEDKLYKDKYDIEFYITNKTKHVIPELKIDGANGAKVWILKNLEPENTEKLRFNIKRDLRISEGGFIFSAVKIDGDSLVLNTGYFTNWGYAPPNPSLFYINDDRIELQK